MEKKLEFKENKPFKLGNRTFLYLVNDSEIYEVDEKILDLLALDGYVYSEAEKKYKGEDFKKEINDIELLIKVPEEEPRIKADKLTALTLMISQECNMKCKYCYGDCGEYNNKGLMTFDTAKSAIDYMLAENPDSKKYNIAFLGGEPLISYDVIKEIVSYCEEKSAEKSINFGFTLTTNGTLLTSEKIKYFKEHKIVCQISIDGNREGHNANRYFSKEKGSYDIVKQKAQKLIEENGATARATLTEDNFDYIEIFNHLTEMGFNAVPMSIAQNMVSLDNFEKILVMYKAYIGYFSSLMLSGKYDKAKKMTDLMNGLDKVHNGTKREAGCGSGRRMVAIDIDGNAYPCHRFVGQKEYCLGNIAKKINRNVFVKEKYSLREECKACWARNLCLGGCAYENTFAEEKNGESSARNCRIMKLMYQEMIKLYVQLTSEDIENIWPSKG